MKLREWQEKALQFFKKNNNSIYQVSTGAGKSIFGIQAIKQILENEPNIRVMIITPKNVILEQTWLDELHNQGFPINKVGIYNQSAKEFSQITLCSIQSLNNVVDSGIYDYYDFIIFDEIHNYGTIGYLKYLQIPKKYKIGLTATLEREDNNDIIIKKIFNFNIFNYGIEDSINDGILNKFDFYCIKIELDEEEQLLYDELTKGINLIIQKYGTGKISRISDEIDRNIFLKLINDRKELVDKNFKKRKEAINIIKDNINSKIIVFNQYNVISKELYWDLADENINSDIINSDIPKNKQIKAFNDFEIGKNNILLTTTMTDEGYNLPKIDTAILMSQNSTNKQFIQRIGRVLRKKEYNSKVYYIVILNTYEETTYNKRKNLINRISNSFNEIHVL